MPYSYERVITPTAGLRLHLNENTAGCSPAVAAVLQRFSRHDAAFYPEYDRAIDACAGRLGVSADSLMLTNGLDEGIVAVTALALRGSRPDDRYEAIVVVPAFDMYAACADALGGRVVEVPLRQDFSFPLDEVLAALTPRTRVIWLTNPNNPTGRLIPREAILNIAAAAPDVLVGVDEAYADFSGMTLLDGRTLSAHPNIVVGRTFAKAYGLAGLRAGALVAAPETLAPLKRIVPPYSLNACSAAALPAAMGDVEYYRWYLTQATASKALLYETFARLGLEYWPSDANFVLVRVGGDAREVLKALAARGVYVRDKSRDRGCSSCLRVTAGVLADTQAFVGAFEEVVCGAAR